MATDELSIRREIAETLRSRPRAYQWEVFNQARKSNVIAYLDTGSGKTLISVLLVKEKAEECRQRAQKKLICFLAPKVDLVKQQADVLREHTDLKVRDYVGEMGIDAWKLARWQTELDKHNVVVCTPAILLDLLHKAYVKMNGIGLIVFDECHHTKKKDPYNRIMQEHYFDPALSVSQRPHIFGMTASPLDTRAVLKAGHVERFFKELEENLNAKIITVRNQEDVKKAAPLPGLKYVWYARNNLAPGSPVATAQERLSKLHTLLCNDTPKWKYEWQTAQGSGIAVDGRLLDDEPVLVETAVFARTIGRILHVLEEVGPYAAMVCFAELLQPSLRTLYEDISKESKKQQETLAQLKRAELDMTPDDMDRDAWWEGCEAQAGDGTKRTALTKQEDASLCLNLADAYHIFVDLLTAVGQPGLLRLTDGQLAELHWSELRERLRCNLRDFEKTMDTALLIEQLLRPQDVEGGRLLVTPKAAGLVALLCEYKDTCIAAQTGDGQPWSCIVFAQQKITCLALARLLKACERHLDFLKTSDFMGFGGKHAALSQTIQMQQRILKVFKSGELNVLVATAVAEEGLDIVHCSLVVRFNLAPTARQFIQSRGRARAQGSAMALMLEHGAEAHQKLVGDALKFEEEMLMQAQGRADLQGPDEEGFPSEDTRGIPRSEQEYVVPSTGAKVTLADAKSLLFRFCNRLPSDRYAGQLAPRFSTEVGRLGGFQTNVYLPSSSPITKASGLAQRTRSLAVSSACLEAVKRLHQAKALTDHLIPDPEVPEAEEDEFSLGPIGTLRESAATRLCPIPPKWPELLQLSRQDSGRVKLHLYRVALTVPGGDSSASAPDLAQPLGVLVPQRFSDIPAIDITFDDKEATKARLEFQHLGEHQFDSQQQQLARTYHNFLIHREVSVEGLLRNEATALEPRKKKQRAWAKRQRFQNLDADSLAAELASKASISNGNGSDELSPLRFYDAALATAKAYQESHGSMPRDPSEEEKMRRRWQAAGPAPVDGGGHLPGSLEQLAPSIEHAQNGAEQPGDNSLRPDNGFSHTAPEAAADTKGDDSDDDGTRLIEAGTGFPSAGALVVPLIAKHEQLVIDWEALSFASKRPAVLDVPVPDLEGLMVLKVHDPIGLYRITRRGDDLRLSSPMPERETDGQQPAEGPRKTFAQHFRDRWFIAGLDPDQPMLQAVPFRSKNDSRQSTFLVPELCTFHPLTRSAHAIAKHVPRILWWLHSLLNAQELRNHLLPQPVGKRKLPDVMAIVEALMPRSCLQHISYERLEIIGDALLKFETTLHCYRAFPLCHEGQLHNVKIKLVCNKHLARVALELLHLDKYIILPNVYFRWAAGHALPVLEVRRKVVADALEALIGAFFMAGGADETSDFLRRILLLPQATQEVPFRQPPAYQPPALGMASKLEQLLGYTFKDRNLLKEACTHASWRDSTTPCYQRLEFLGDAILDVLITQTLAERHKDIEPGMVSDIREAAVNNTRLACVAAAHRCHHALRHCSTPLMHDMAAFVRLFDQTLRELTPEEELARQEAGDERRASNEALGRTYSFLTDHSYGLQMACAPKAMADLVEALAGAIYIDSNCQLEPVWKVLYDMMMPLPTPETVAIHPVRVLMEKASKRHFTLRFWVDRRADHQYDVDGYINLYLIASAQEQVSSKSGKITVARKALQIWSETFDYSAAAGKSAEPDRAAAAAAFAEAAKDDVRMAATTGQRNVIMA